MRTLPDPSSDSAPSDSIDPTLTRRHAVKKVFYGLLSLSALSMLLRPSALFAADDKKSDEKKDKKADKKTAKNSAAIPLPAGDVEVPATDAVANAIGYVADASKYDKAKYKTKVANAACGNCALFTKVNDGWGKCQMIQSGDVNIKGWCGSWSKKT